MLGRATASICRSIPSTTIAMNTPMVVSRLMRSNDSPGIAPPVWPAAADPPLAVARLANICSCSWEAVLPLAGDVVKDVPARALERLRDLGGRLEEDRQVGSLQLLRRDSRRVRAHVDRRDHAPMRVEDRRRRAAHTFLE